MKFFLYAFCTVLGWHKGFQIDQYKASTSTSSSLSFSSSISSRFPTSTLTSTSLYASNEEPTPYLQSNNEKQKLIKTIQKLLPFSLLFGALGVSLSQKQKERLIASKTSPSQFSYSELRDVIHEGKVFVIKDFIDQVRARVRVKIEVNNGNTKS
jgi:hypothetical protein